MQYSGTTRFFLGEELIANQLLCRGPENYHIVTMAASHTDMETFSLLFERCFPTMNETDLHEAFHSIISNPRDKDAADIARRLLLTGRVNIEALHLSMTPLQRAVQDNEIALCRVLILEGRADSSKVIKSIKGKPPYLLSPPDFREEEMMEALLEILKEANLLPNISDEDADDLTIR
jgi:hypothetical protein